MTDFNDLFGLGTKPTNPQGSKPSRLKPEKGVQIHGRRIDGSYYVRAADVVALLEANAILPNTVRLLRKAIES